ncbi:MAG: M20 family peptidase [Candidatus Sericytochromatia bacterium]
MNGLGGKRALWALPAAVLLFAGILIWNTSSLATRQPLAAEASVGQPANPQAALKRLSQAIALPTVSWQDPQIVSSQTFDRLHQLLRRSFPLVYSRLTPRRIGHSLLIKWPGAEPGTKPVLLAAHLDVVPAEQAGSWEHGPFSGLRSGGYVWGRGTLDDKASAMALLEGVETLLGKGYKPKRTVYLAFGSDEEIGGRHGAERLARELKNQGVRLAGVLDEGLAIVPGSMIGLKPPVALIGIAEKGYLTLELSVNQPGGHSSMPPAETSVDILARALLRLRQQPLPARLTGPAGELFKWLNPEMKGLNRLALANRWLFEGMLIGQLSQKPSTNALIRTTIAPTLLSAGSKENVLASQARAVINLRVLPGDTAAGILAHFNHSIGDQRVKLRTLSDPSTGQASKVSRTDSELFRQIAGSIRQIFPEALVAPSLVLAATDSRHYEGIADDIYRFLPVYLEEKDFDRIHGRNERISEKAYFKQIQFYQQLIARL